MNCEEENVLTFRGGDPRLAVGGDAARAKQGIGAAEMLYRAKCIVECLIAARNGHADDQISEPTYALDQVRDLIEEALGEPELNS